MQKYISILRGINVGGKRKILMKELKEVYQNLEFLDVQTYIQSGNVIFESDNLDKREISNKIERAIFDTYNFEVPVIIRTKEELLNIQSSNPFVKNEDEKKNNLDNLTFLEEIPTTQNLEKAKEKKQKKLNQKLQIDLKL